MCNRWCLPALLLGLGIGLGGFADGAADDDAGRIGKLVKQLGSTRFAERDRAKRALETIGTPALDALRQAARSKDLETSRRAGELVKRMEEKIALDSLLAPKRVRLNVKDMPVPQAVAELARQSGYQLEILGDRAALGNRKITLDTGDTTFWQALDQLCQKAGLAENVQPYNPYGNPYSTPGLVPPPPPIRIQPAPALGLPAVKPALQFRQVQPGAVQIQIEVKAQAIQPAVPGQAPAVPAPKAAPAVPVQRQPAPALKVAPAQLQVQPPPAVQPPPGVQPPLGVQPPPAGPAFRVQIQPGFVGRPTSIRPFNPNQILLTDGKRAATPTCYAGSVRVRVAPSVPAGVPAPTAPRREGEALVLLEVSAEPRMQSFQLLGDVQIDRALDDQGQKLSVPMEPMPGGQPAVVGLGGLGARRVYGYNPYNVFNRYAYVRLKRGEKQAKTLKELSGHVSAQMLSPLEPVVTVANVLKAGGKKTEGKGGTLDVQSVVKQADGTYQVQFRLETAPGFLQAPFQGPVAPLNAMPANGPGGVQVGPGGQIQRIRIVRQGYNTHGLPTLTDAKGRSYQLTQPPQRIYRANFGGGLSQDITMVFRAHESQGEPAQLVLHGQRNISVQIPFTLRDVTLP